MVTEMGKRTVQADGKIDLSLLDSNTLYVFILRDGRKVKTKMTPTCYPNYEYRMHCTDFHRKLFTRKGRVFLVGESCTDIVKVKIPKEG